MKEDFRIRKANDNKGVTLSVVEVLMESEEKKLENDQLLHKIEKIAEKLEISWHVEQSANVEYSALVVSRTFQTEFGKVEYLALKKATDNFLRQVRDLDIPKPECTSHQMEDDNAKEYLRIAKRITECGDILTGAMLMRSVPECHILNRLGVDEVPSGKVSSGFILNLCDFYIKGHEQ